jgi:CubicO group peptidase (beta-lactamase class C family)
VDASKVGRVTSVFTYGPDKRLVRATPPRGQETRYENPSAKPVFLSGGGGLFSTTDDYFRFAQMMLTGGEANGKRFLKRSTVELMRTNVLAEGVEVGANGPGIGFGLDFAIVTDPVAANTPQGRNSFYWGGAFGTWFWIDPTNDVVVVGMIQNVNGSQPTGGTPPVRLLSRQLVYQALVDPKK